MAATGLPENKFRPVLAEAPPILDGDRYSSASAWGKIAASAASVTDTAEGLYHKELVQQQAKATADFENDNADWFVKARDEFAHDPKGFEAAALAHKEGAISQVPPWLAPHAQKFLGGKLETNLATILSETRHQNKTLAAQSLDARAQSSANEVMALAMAGKVGKDVPEWVAANQTYNGVLDTAVSTGLMAPEKADLLRDDLAGKAQGESAARKGVEIYRAQGFEAASNYLRSSILENDQLSLKAAQKYAIHSRGLAAINLARKEDQADKAGVVELGRDLSARIKIGQDVDPGEIDDQLKALARVGAHADYARLSKDYAVHQATAPYRNGSVPLGEFGAQIRQMRGGASVEDVWRSIYQQESGSGRNNATSITGARGPGQIQPGTWAQYARPGENIDNPADNVAVSKRIVSDLYQKAGGDPARVAVGYFSGPGNIAPPGSPTPWKEDKIDPNKKLVSSYVADVVGRMGGGTVTPGAVTAQAQRIFVEQARKSWPDMESMIGRGRTPTADEFDAVRYAASISGDPAWMHKVEAAGVTLGFNQSGATLADKQGAVDDLKARAAQGGYSVEEDQVVTELEKRLEKQTKQVKENPVGLAIDRGAKAPDPLNFASPQAAAAAVTQRVALARGVAAGDGAAYGNPFQPADQQAIAGAIVGGDPARAGAAFEALAVLPDEFLVPGMSATTIKAAVTGAARGSDPGKFNAAMQLIDRLYQRAPEDMTHLLGTDVIKNLQDWQAKLRYYSPAELAEQLKRRDDPQVMERHKVNIKAGETIARAVKPESLIGEWQGFFGLTGPGVPVDPRTRDAFMGDYETLFGERYAVLLDKSTAHKQAVERMKPYWQASGVNGGRLTLYAPETVYQPVAGSHDWMKTQLETGIEAKIGRKPADYMIVSDATTERDVTARRPASYMISVKNAATGEWDVLRDANFKPSRFAWDNSMVKPDAREEFARQRARVFAPAQDLAEAGLP